MTRLECTPNVYEAVKDFFREMGDIFDDLLYWYNDLECEIICNYSEQSVMIDSICLRSCWNESEVKVVK